MSKFSSRATRRARRRTTKSEGVEASVVHDEDEGSSPSPAEFSIHVIDAALRMTREQGRRLLFRQQLLLASAIAGVSYFAVRGAASFLLASSAAPALALSLLSAFVVFFMMLLLSLRARRRIEHLAREVQTLDLTRAALTDETPRVEIRPHRSEAGAETPVLVVRADSIERLLGLDGSRGRGGALPLVLAPVVVLVLLAGGGGLLANDDRASEGSGALLHRWTFLDDPNDPFAMGFDSIDPERTAGGVWEVAAHEAATGARALVNRSGQASAPPAILVATALQARDLRLATRCKVAPASPTLQRACGVVFRHLDAQNYDVARIEVDTRRLVLASVVDGAERVLGALDAHVSPGVWQELLIEARAEEITASLNGRDTLTIRSADSHRAGGGGLWVPAGAEAYFDELAIETFGGARPGGWSSALVPLLTKGKS